MWFGYAFMPRRYEKEGVDVLRDRSKQPLRNPGASHVEEPFQANESTFYHYFEQNYTPLTTESGPRFARC